MYSYREVDFYFFGTYLVLLLLLLVALKLLDRTRFNFMVLFWIPKNHNEELAKAFKPTRAFSLITLTFRALVFGVLLNAYLTEQLNAKTFTMDVGYYALGFMVFWTLRVFYEYILTRIWGQYEKIFKLNHLRCVEKEKLAFVYNYFILALAYFSLPPIAVKTLALTYCIGLIILHFITLKRYFKYLTANPFYIIVYICASEIVPLWLLSQTLNY
ncbi:MAG: DUF4271 domain-containing protein [Flavobacteriaceae bacterium]|nr:DUF4271 domain-containing protein [Flavobacteriaceae bacterium]